MQGLLSETYLRQALVQGDKDQVVETATIKSRKYRVIWLRGQQQQIRLAKEDHHLFIIVDRNTLTIVTQAITRIETKFRIIMNDHIKI